MLILLAAIVVLGGWLIYVYNSLIGLRNQTLNAFKQIDVQLKRRYDLIPNLVNAVKGEMKFEQQTLERVIAARNGAVSANATGDISKIAKSEGELTMALGRLFALSENYPTLKANEAVAKLMEELSHTENNISFSRQLYNDMATKFNTSQQVFPNNILAGMLGFTASVLFELPQDSAERQAPKVEL